MIDIGANLTNRVFDSDRDAIMERAARAGVKACIVTGTCVRTSRAAAKLCDSDHTKTLWFTSGVHPHNAKQCNSGTIRALRELAAHPQCVAIGECGLDFNRDFSPRPIQEQWFQAQIDLAKELGKPLFLHCRDAEARFKAILGSGKLSGVVQCFTGRQEDLDAYLHAGLHIGITGWVADERRGQGLARLLPRIPADRLLIETDCPYLTPRTVPNGPRRNEPSLLPYVLAAVAKARSEAPETTAAQTTANARRLFGITL
ncbi:3'-5' ssDNA/RNA exonuclease TatD [Chlorella vulgaris]